MFALAVSAEEGSNLTATCDGAVMATPRAGLAIGAEASVFSVGVVAGAEWACEMGLFADRVVVTKGEALRTVRSGRRRTEECDAARSGEQTDRSSQSFRVIRGESDDNRHCLLTDVPFSIGC